ncbi:pyruvate kinase [uncultured Clostridium sp.]|jgi:pyruvate kinase|uniref:pyruvate kinase n=1 Tax=uncultured Clostridium sp. TaxID=59620 RepID=UPI0026238242|nr:pyruvate kinase [uncultured Clostridium sp.]
MYLIATIGPRSCENNIIDAIVKGGADTIRINLSHGKYDDIDKVIGYIRRNYHDVKILMDLQGHKVRVSHKLKKEFFADKGLVTYFCSQDDYESLVESHSGNEKIIPLNISSEQIRSVQLTKVYMKDGIMQFNVLENRDGIIKTITKIGGMVRAEKGCNLPGLQREHLDLTEKDKKDIQFALNEKVDILCYSYCSSESDCEKFKKQVFDTLRRGDKIPRLFAKIETKEGVKNISVIAKALDGVVIARGDLVPESDLLALPIIQEKIVSTLNKQQKEVIVATHVLNSMKKKGTKPHISELSDIYNMIRKNVSGFMLTGETTIGDNQFEVVKTLKQVMDYYSKISEKIKKK